jgi:hypothetical protein
VRRQKTPAECGRAANLPRPRAPEPNKTEGPNLGRQITVDRSSTTTAPQQRHHAALNTCKARR